ncbi:hypothetical protein K9M47_03775 [Candidatus Gracilibacteria bacterium]|nr:hypothetical protein [Candidatus Gracilibacteria bacterium]MCF7898446.1 hypothetical protein [Candidatus Paceibacterota bacterium]
MVSPLFDLRKQLEIYFFSILIIVSVVYGGWEAYPLLAGPHITISTPHDGDIVASTTFQISGVVSRVKNIEIQGRVIPIDKDGNFNEILIAQPPYTTIIVNATDFYDKTITKTLKVIPK